MSTDTASAPTRTFTAYAGQEPQPQSAKPSAAPPVSTHEWRQLHEQAERAAYFHAHCAAELSRLGERISRELRAAAVNACRHTSGDVIYNWNKHRPTGLVLLKLDAELSLAAAAAAVAHYTAELATPGMVDTAKRAAAEDAEAQRRRVADTAAAQAKLAADKEAEKQRIIERAQKEREHRAREGYKATTPP